MKNNLYFLLGFLLLLGFTNSIALNARSQLWACINAFDTAEQIRNCARN